MSTNYNLLGKGFVKLGLVVLLFILAPILISMGFKGIKIYTESPQIYIGYGFLFFGFAVLIFSIIFAYRALKTIMKGIFKS